MGALTPIFLVAAVSVGVPLWLHLFHRHETRRISFPALRYLGRTERDHARRIRLRQLLLLLARMAVLVAVVGAGARLFFRGRGTAHPPTAVVIVLDNSMSSGLVVGEERVLDGLKALALRSLELATPDDRVWVLRVGEPWIPSVPGGPREARAEVEATEVSAGAGDLTSALRRATELLATSSLQSREIHLLSDLQASGFTGGEHVGPSSVPVVAWSGPGALPRNHSIAEVLIGGGLPPLEGQRSELAVRAGTPETGDTMPFPVRVVVDGRIRGAATVPPASATTVPIPPTGSGWVRGWVEADADALRADDRRHFAFRSRLAPVVRLEGDAPLFLEESLGVLMVAGRVRAQRTGPADLVIAMIGEGAGRIGAGGAVLIVPPSDPTLLPALNRRLSDAGIPWRYESSSPAGEGSLEGARLPLPLEGTRVRSWYHLRLEGEPPGPPRTLALIGAEPWLVEGNAVQGGRYLMLGSALDPESSTLPVSTAMVTFLDWAASQWAGSGTGAVSRTAGLPIPAPRTATHVRLPSDTVVEIDGTRSVRGAASLGFYTFMAGDSIVAVEAVNPPEAESRLTRLSGDGLEAALGTDGVVVSDQDRWDRAIFRARQGPELWRPLMLAAALLLAIEALLSASGRVVLNTTAERARSRVDA
jgi:hypothetical protein